MSTETATPVPAAGTETATPTPAQGAPDATEKPVEGATTATEAPAAGTPDATDPKAEALAAVVKRRDASQLAALVREKKALEGERAKVKESESRLSVLQEFDRLYEDDPAAAVEYMLAQKAGDETKAKQILAQAYDGLTSRILGVESKAQPAKVERSVSRLEREIEAIKQREAQALAKLAEKEATERELQEQGALQQVGQFLTSAEKEYPYLMAEADDAAAVVFELLRESTERGHEMTLGEAAQRANEYFQPAVERKAARYQNLLAPDKATGTPSKPEMRPSQTSQSRTSITNADASHTPQESAPPPPATEQERINRAFAVLRKGHGLGG